MRSRLLLAATLLTACTAAPSAPAEAGIDAPSPVDVSLDVHASEHGASGGDVPSAPEGATDGAGTDGTADSGFMALAPCLTPEGYRDGVGVGFGGSVGDVYAPMCLRARVGATVTFEGSFVEHPLRPTPRGTAGSPIPVRDSGDRVAVTFLAPGFFTYYCPSHGDRDGNGMAGVVQVVP